MLIQCVAGQILNAAVNASAHPTHPFATLCAFFNEAHCAWRLVTYFWNLFFFFFFFKGLPAFWRLGAGGGGGALYLPYVGFAVTVADFWNAKSKLSVWKSPSVAPPLIFPKKKERKKENAGLAVVVHLSPILTGAERARKAPFQVLSPRVCFPESFCLCCRRVYLVFLRHSREIERERNRERETERDRERENEVTFA